MLSIQQVTTEEDKVHVRDLFWEYLQWAKQKVDEEYGWDADISAMLDDDMAHLGKFLPPDGRLGLASFDGQVAGLGCLHKIGANVLEIKRMYVRPEFRGKGIGRGILDWLLAEGRSMGYPLVRLDSAKFMQAAHALYRSAGFKEIAVYPESEIPEEFRENWLFMELELS